MNLSGWTFRGRLIGDKMTIGVKTGGHTMSDDTHVTDVGGLVHKGPNLVLMMVRDMVKM